MDNIKNGIVLESEAPYQNRLEPLNKGYWISGAIGVVLGLVTTGNLAGMILFALALALFWLLLVNKIFALGYWRALRYDEFWIKQQISSNELTSKLVQALSSYGLRVDVYEGMPQIDYKTIRIRVQYNENGTFSLPWTQKLGWYIFDFRYISGYINTVYIMSIIGYNIQKICAQASDNNLTAISSTNAEPTKETEDIISPQSTQASTTVCQSCGTPLPLGVKFCSKCGAEQKVQRYCPNCGAQLLLNAKFCGKCGTKFND